jgi:hypothetical protein
MNAASKKLKYYDQSVKDPYAQIADSGFTPIGNLKTYGVANMYDRPEPTHLRDLPDLYTIPYSTTPFLGSTNNSIKYVDTESQALRPPVFNHKKSAIDTSQVSYHPNQIFLKNNGVSDELNYFYEQATTINLDTEDYVNKLIDGDKVKLGEIDDGLISRRYVNRWDHVDPRITQNVDHIIMNMKKSDGTDISLFQCGISTRNELRNFVEESKC